MIKFRNLILENYSIDPITAVITNSKGEIQKTKIRDGRPYFKGHKVYEWQMHTHVGYKKGMDIHHIDKNKMNNSLENLVYLTRSEHIKMHSNGNKNMFGKHHSEDAKRKMSEAHKGENHPLYGKRFKWINNGFENRYIPLDDEIPEGFIRGRLKRKIS